MALNIRADWHQPLELKPDGLGYSCPEIDSVPNARGIYVFGRWYGEIAVPLYIGRSKTLRQRLEQNLNSVQLMNAIRNAPKGYRFFLYCTVNGESDKRLKTLESALIAHALAQDHQLFNKQGTKTPTHTVTFGKNNHTSLEIVPRRFRLRA